MNASVSALNREGEVQSKIGKVRAFGRIARIVCSAIFGFGLVGSVGVFLIGILGIFLPNLRGGADFTPEQRMSALPMAAMVVGVYTPENVRRVRNVGFLWLLLAAFSILIPVASTALNAFGIAVTKSALAFSLSESLSAFAAAGLILLASWIMDVGLFEKDHAEALQRDADLVI
jgi:hypothetical protein